MGIASAVLFFAACGGDGGRGTNESADAGTDAGPLGFEPTPPAPAAWPALAPCPAGWRQAPDPDSPEIVVCEPWPEGGPVDCGAAEAHFPGGDGCEPVGSACPAGDFPDDLPAGSDVVYVQAGAPAGGDGTISAPFDSISQGMLAASSGGVVAIAKGTYDERLSVSRRVTLWGACAAETVVDWTSGAEDAAVATVTGGGAALRNLRLTGPHYGVYVHDNSAPVVLEGIAVEGAHFGGLYLAGDVDAHDLVVRDTVAGADGRGGNAVYATGGAQVDLSRGAFERSTFVGWALAEAGTAISASDVAVRNTRPSPRVATIAVGIAVTGGSRCDLERAVVEGALGAGFTSGDPGTTLSARDLVVRDIRVADGAVDTASGVETLGASVVLERTLVERCDGVGLLAGLTGATIAATDVLVRDVESDPSGLDGYGMQIASGGLAVLDRVAFLRTRVVGVIAFDAGTDLDASDLFVADGRSMADGGEFGGAIVVLDGAHAHLERATFERNLDVAVLGQDGASIDGTDVAVSDTRGRESDLRYGYGIHLNGGSTIDLSRVAVVGSHAAGLFLAEEGTRGVFEDLLVSGTERAECFETVCADTAWGTGIVATDGAAIQAERFRTSDNAQCGLQLASGGALDLHQGEVSRNPVGANVQTAGFDLVRIEDDVAYIENDLDLDSATIPVPEALRATGR